jgi:methyl-accepting chemotaxis protein
MKMKESKFMKMIKKITQGLKGKILLPVLAIFIASIAVILAIVLGISSGSINDLSNSLMQEKNMHYSSEVQGKINASLDSVKTLKLSVEQSAQQGGNNREVVIDMLKKVVEDNDTVFGAYTLWEPNAFDGNDAAYAGKSGYDDTGRFIPYVVRGDAGIYVEALKDYEQEGAGDYYQLPKKTGKACVLDPFEYETGGKKVFLTSMVVPIFIDGKFAGIVGEDILVDTLIQEIKGTKILDSGYIFLSDSTGKVFFHPNKEVVGNPLFNYFDEDAAATFKKAMTAGKGVSFNTVSKLADNERHYVIDPVTVGFSKWWVGSTTPVSEISKPTTRSLTFGITAGVASAAIISILLILLISWIIKPIKNLVNAADKLAMGDIDVNIAVATNDEIGTLMESFGHMAENIRSQAITVEKIADGDLTVDVEVKSENDLLGKKLYELVEKNNEVLANIAFASEQVSSGARQVSDSSIALSQGATEQASSIEELTASIEEISAQTRQNAEYANKANELTVTTKMNAIRGNEQMGDMLRAMEDINESSENISKIIKVIDEIAFQTNILALNAAVEAARAGQQGKGFSVVAEEVRNLAARSAKAAKETADMIEGSIKKVEGGSKIAHSTAEALTRIVNDVEEVAELVNDIAVSSNEQAAGISQINQGLMQVSQVVQNNSASSEESAAASEELSGQAEMLREQVNRYTLKHGGNLLTGTDLGEISPAVMKMLASMDRANKLNGNGKAEFTPMAPVKGSNSKRILLSENEFGKY